MTLAEQLKLIQKVSGLSQERLAARLGVSFVALNRWIGSKALPRPKAKERIEALYCELTGEREIPADALQGKKRALMTQSKRAGHILKKILGRKDLLDQFVLSLTYHSNRIEGSTLTEDETAAVIFQNITLPGKSLVEHLEAKNHQTALEYLLKSLLERKPLTEALILRLHGILMNGIRSDAWSYRAHAVRIVGSRVVTANYLKVPEQMRELCANISRRPADPIAHAADVHARLEKTHPFSDGNGRVGRLLMNGMFLRDRLPPAIIRADRKPVYLKSLEQAQLLERLAPLEDFLCDSLFEGFGILEG